MELAVVGSDDFVTGFQLVGMRHTYPVDEQSFDSRINELIEMPEIGILVVEEKDLSHLTHLTKKRLENLVTPVIVALSREGKESSLRDMIKKSVGVDLWK